MARSTTPLWSTYAGGHGRRDVIQLPSGQLTELIKESDFRNRLDLEGIGAGVLCQPVLRGRRKVNEPGKVGECRLPVSDGDDNLERQATDTVDSDHHRRPDLLDLRHHRRVKAYVPDFPLLGLGIRVPPRTPRNQSGPCWFGIPLRPARRKRPRSPRTRRGSLRSSTGAGHVGYRFSRGVVMDQRLRLDGVLFIHHRHDWTLLRRGLHTGTLPDASRVCQAPARSPVNGARVWGSVSPTRPKGRAYTRCAGKPRERGSGAPLHVGSTAAARITAMPGL